MARCAFCGFTHLCLSHWEIRGFIKHDKTQGILWWWSFIFRLQLTSLQNTWQRTEKNTLWLSCSWHSPYPFSSQATPSNPKPLRKHYNYLSSYAVLLQLNWDLTYWCCSKKKFSKEPVPLFLNCLKNHKDPSTDFDFRSQLLISVDPNKQMQPFEINAFYCFYKPQWIWFSTMRITITDSISLGFSHASLPFLLGPEEAKE